MNRPPWTPTDGELALRASDGQAWAFEELLERHADLLHGHARQIYAPGESYDDMLQAARVALHKAALTFDPARGASFRQFASIAIRAELITILKAATRAKHEVLNRSKCLDAPLHDDGHGGEPVSLTETIPAASSTEPEALALAREELERLVLCVQTRLSPLERTVLARRLRGDSLEDCGRGLGSAASRAKTADNALQRVRRKLAA